MEKKVLHLQHSGIFVNQFYSALLSADSLSVMWACSAICHCANCGDAETGWKS